MSDLNEQLRAAFEAWARSVGLDLAIGRTGYDDHATYDAWQEWQRRALPAPQAAPSDVTEALRTAASDLRATYKAIAIHGGPVVSVGQFRRLSSIDRILAAAPAVAITQAATSEPVAKTDLSRRLRVIAANPVSAGMAPLLRADILAAAEEIERYYGGMLNWKATAQAKDAAHLAGTTPNTEAPSESPKLKALKDKRFELYGVGPGDAKLDAEIAAAEGVPTSSYDFEDQLDRLITEVSNASHKCGGYNMHDGEEGYEPILKAAYAAEGKLRAFVRSVSRAALSAQQAGHAAIFVTATTPAGLEHSPAIVHGVAQQAGAQDQPDDGNCRSCKGDFCTAGRECVGAGRDSEAGVQEAPSEDAKDAARLDFMIEDECQIEVFHRPHKAPMYRVRWPWREEHQREFSRTAREAIDSARAALAAATQTEKP